MVAFAPIGVDGLGLLSMQMAALEPAFRGDADMQRLVAPGTIHRSMNFARASAGLAVGADGVTWQSYEPNAPRFTGVAQRLLVEGQRSNEALYNTAFAPGWSIQGIESTTPLVAPDNSTNGRRITETSASSRHILERGITVTGGTPYTISIAAKAGTTPYLQICFGLASSGHANFDLAAGAVTVIGSGTTAAITPMGNGWYLCEATVTPAASGTMNCGFGLANSATMARIATYEGTGAYLDVWCFQVERAAFASSRMMTTTSAIVTRAADVATYILSAAQAQQGTLVGTFMTQAVGINPVNTGFLVLDGGSNTNRMLLRLFPNSAIVRGTMTLDGTTTSGAASGQPSITNGEVFKIALAWDRSGFAYATKGGPVVTMAGLPPLTRLMLGQGDGFALNQPLCGEIGPLDLYPTRLPDSVLQAMTAA
jgi:hypothetical protein